MPVSNAIATELIVPTRSHLPTITRYKVVHAHAARLYGLRLLLRLCILRRLRRLEHTQDGFGRVNLSFRILVRPLETVALALEARDLLPRFIKCGVDFNRVSRASSACSSTRHDSY